MSTDLITPVWYHSVHSDSEFVELVNTYGCCTAKCLPAWPLFPNQQQALAELGMIDVWFWKDDLHAEKRLFYTRLFGGKPGFVSMSLLPVMVAAFGRVFDEMLFRGELPAEAVDIYRAIEQEGPIGIKPLKAMLAHIPHATIDKYLQLLDRKLLITKCGVTGRTRGTYGFIWDTTEHWMPEILRQAQSIGTQTAREMVCDHMRQFAITPDGSFWKRQLDVPSSETIFTRK